MRTMKMVVIFLAVVLVAGACSSGAGNDGGSEGGENSSDAVTLHMAKLESDPNGMMEEARQRFNEQHDDIQVEYVEMSNNASEMHDQTVTQLTAKSDNLDIVNLDVVWVAEFAEAGWLKPLDELFTEDMQSNYIERQVEAMKYDGNIWAVPWFNDLHPLWYRQDLLEKYNRDVPETYTEAVETAQLIQEEEGMQGFSMHWGRSEQLIVSFTEFLHSKGGSFFDEQGNVTINSPEAVEALQFMVDMIEEYEVVSPSAIGNSTPDDARIPFTQGQSVFHPNWGYVYSVNQADDSPVKDKTWVASNPGFEGGQKANAVGGWNFAIAKHTEHAEEAWQVIEWFTSFENQKKVLLGGGQVGTHLDLYEDEEVLEANPYLEEYLTVFEHASTRPTHPQYAQVSDIAQSHIHEALNGDVSPQEALDALASELKELN
ncbi:ABC transporter substrate-binding protein [Salibacterium halotolerans]|uniref:Multiple sugar transport system substrate-binding protein n=1 Tax=Salibacterium halotolerans TaxID=1884432 RepID=A0A1I5XLT5_9BACI|nr:ABC transporter substrate-binding protein [Salibacterium halotolerans]SFQ32776.1 multiple sugar transport system substrate-binding protein [Salibacterium halotolerans]